MLMGMSMLPDDPLLLFFLLSARALYRTITLDHVHGWLWVGLWFGLAGLSKYTAVTLVVSALLLIASERRWSQLRTPWPWLAVLIAFVAISPVLWWNWQHGWISFRYQVFHVDDPQRSWSMHRFLLSQAIQFLAY
jgi:4-amino-4-deoxy-L-arabinose transferase-like glycosyltransferase